MEGTVDAASSAHHDRQRALLHESCQRALPAVAQLWPQWGDPVDIEISDVELEEGTAAYVEGMARAGEPATDNRVVVAGGLTEQLSPDGLDIVLRHELTHLAMRSLGTVALPLWATEGIAMHVGYSGVPDIRRERTAELVALQDRRDSGAWPGTLPDVADFDDPAQREHAYTAAWLAMVILVGHAGSEQVTTAMRADGSDARTTGPGDLEDDERTESFLADLGVSRSWLDARWREELERRTS